MKRIARVALLGALAAAVVVAIPAVRSQGLEGYAGVTLCNACHKGPNADIVAAFPASAHASALWAVGDATEHRRVAGDFAADPGFKLEDVAWVLGKGVGAQAYLDANFQAFPQEWSVYDKRWRAGETGDARQSCLGCHTTGYDPAAATWKNPGVTCEACHGPGQAHARAAADRRLATVVRPQELSPERQAMICGRCHAIGKDAAGRPFAAGYVPGEDLKQKFTLATDYERGARYSQYNDLVRGKHLAAGVTCTTCHDPHGVSRQPHQLRKPADDLCTGCHQAAQLTGPQHTPAQDCVRCHMPQGSHRFDQPQVVPAGTPHHH